jgi:hypothetical protein
MPETWIEALKTYHYPVYFEEFFKQFPKFAHFQQDFDFDILHRGDRDSTIKFEDHFREKAEKSIAVWCEVVWWKLYVRRGAVKKIVERLKANDTKKLWDVCHAYINKPTISTFDSLRYQIVQQKVLATAATFPAFMVPEQIPMVDKRIAKWVNKYHRNFNNGDRNSPQLLPFPSGDCGSVLQMGDFDAMFAWISWCRCMANKLNKKTDQESFKWRARDVEMAVFQAWGRGKKHPVILNPI